MHCAHTVLQRSRSKHVLLQKVSHSAVKPDGLVQAGVGAAGIGADLQVRDGVIEIRAIRRNPREGWADDARRLAGQGDDALLWPELANTGDNELVW